MNNFNNMFNLINMFKSGNPQQIAMNLLQQSANNNPVLKNVMDMANAGNGQAIEQIARNLCKSKGIDADKMFNDIKQQFKP